MNLSERHAERPVLSLCTLASRVGPVLVTSVTCVCVCLQMEDAELRAWIEKLQARLQACGVDSPQHLQTVLESVVLKKQSLCETLQSWNTR